MGASPRSAVDRLAALFDEDRDGLVEVRPCLVVPRVVFLDLDGVLTRECEYFEIAWGVVGSRVLRDGPDPGPADLTAEDLERGARFRRSTKGGVPLRRMQQLLREAGPSVRPDLSAEQLQDVFYAIVNSLIEDEYGTDPERYLLPGARPLLEQLQRRGIETHLVTANIQPQAVHVVEFTGIGPLFTQVHGYPTRLADDEATPRKSDTMRAVLEARGLARTQAAYLGDGESDVEFGREAGVVTVGIANEKAAGPVLLEAGADAVATSTRAWRDVLKYLGLPPDDPA